MSELLPCVVIEPSRAAVGAVVWLHGLGADGHDFSPIVPVLGLPEVRFVFPHAPAIPVTINAGLVMPAWYDIRSLDRSPHREDPAQIRASARRVEALVQREIDRGIASTSIVLAGFSQGAAMALHVGLRLGEPLAGIVALSGYLVIEDALAAERSAANRDTPVFFGHGRHDDLVPLEGGRHAHDTVRALDPTRPVTWREYPMGHEVSPAEIADVATWLHPRFRGPT